MRILFLLPAKLEFKQAITYYNTQRDGLGYEFALEVQQTLKRHTINLSNYAYAYWP